MCQRTQQLFRHNAKNASSSLSNAFSNYCNACLIVFCCTHEPWSLGQHDVFSLRHDQVCVWSQKRFIWTFEGFLSICKRCFGFWHSISWENWPCDAQKGEGINQQCKTADVKCSCQPSSQCELWLNLPTAHWATLMITVHDNACSDWSWDCHHWGSLDQQVQKKRQLPIWFSIFANRSLSQVQPSSQRKQANKLAGVARSTCANHLCIIKACVLCSLEKSFWWQIIQCSSQKKSHWLVNCRNDLVPMHFQSMCSSPANTNQIRDCNTALGLTRMSWWPFLIVVFISSSLKHAWWKLG